MTELATEAVVASVAKEALATNPVTLLPVRVASPLPLPLIKPITTLPDTLSPVNTPTDLMFGCALAVTIPAVSVAALTLAKLASSSDKGSVPVAFAKMYGTVIVVSRCYLNIYGTKCDHVTSSLSLFVQLIGVD